jgi:HD-GYP domain-containing protein (c-di-GMP phosphodiesterase class II)
MEFCSMSTNDDLFNRLEQLNEVGVALSRERDINRLIEHILLAAKNITRAEGGTLYLKTEDQTGLRFVIVRNDKLGFAFGGPSGKPIAFPNLPFMLENFQPNFSNVAVYAALQEKTVNIPDAYSAEGFDFTGTRKFDASNGYRSQSFLTVPMMNHEGKLLGVLQLINALDPETGEVVVFSSSAQHLAESLASQAAIALSNRQLISQLENLFESFINLINHAIDDKSPYTGKHCARVPDIAMMLAEACHNTTSGPMADFTMTAKDRYELKIAAMLHDCGKVTTPVHVVDKATKLETIFDRIHLVDTRFEVLRRDARIAMLEKKLALREAKDAAAEAALDQEYAAWLAQVTEDQEFLRRSNTGGEFMKDPDQQRVRDIGTRYRWRIGDGEEMDFLSAEEIKNLTIRAGTLTQEEREIINHHIVATIDMLEKLQWPDNLTNVTEYAGGHHERMDGKGYPKGLTRDQMSPQARMLAIADVFEALTANDRPYKRAMKLSQALSILDKMSKEGHIDPDLFDVFLREKIYLTYAERYLSVEQIDDISGLKLGSQPAQQ